MARFLLLSAALLLAASPSFASDQTADTLAQRIDGPSPQYPAVCRPGAEETAAPETVTVVFDLNRNGQTQNVRVRESTNPCFDEAAVAAVRGWRYELRRVSGRTVEQNDLEVTFDFVFEQETVTNEFDARPTKRVPPRYPGACIDRAAGEEFVIVQFTVTQEGKTDDFEIIETTNRCFNRAAIRAVGQWEYQPRIIDGVPVERKNVQTQITFELEPGARSAENKVRRRFALEINRVGRGFRRGKDPVELLVELEEIEEKYGGGFSQAELSAFHQTRGAVRLELKQYAGALDDFRIVRSAGMNATTAQAIDTVIMELEQVVEADREQPDVETKALSDNEESR